MLIETKICTKCGVEKPLTEYSNAVNPDSKVNFGSHYKPRLSNHCKDCCAEYQREYRKRKLKENPNHFKRKVKLTVEERLLNSFISNRLTDAKQRSKRYSKPFKVTKDYLKKLWTGYCAISKQPITMVKHDTNVGSLDCIIPELGYVEGNLQWVSWKVNRAKGDLTNNEFLSMCKSVIEGATTIETTSK